MFLLDSLVVRASDLRLNGREFDPRPPRYPVFYHDTLGLGGNCQHWGEDVGVWGLWPQRGPGAL